SDIMRDNHILNMSGLPEHFVGADLNIEHNIGNIKETYSSKGVYADWDHLGDIAGSTIHMQAAKKKVGKMFDTSYKKKTHSNVNTTDLV
ncbi:hypothetical protein BDP27DRAFT_1198239, partial [Rhodocollybia butyracea]